MLKKCREVDDQIPKKTDWLWNNEPDYPKMKKMILVSGSLIIFTLKEPENIGMIGAPIKLLKEPGWGDTVRERIWLSHIIIYFFGRSWNSEDIFHKGADRKVPYIALGGE